MMWPVIPKRGTKEPDSTLGVVWGGGTCPCTQLQPLAALQKDDSVTARYFSFSNHLEV